MRTNLFVFCLIIVFCLSAAVSADPGYYEQLDMIADNAETWKQDVEFGNWGYTVTDLDQNGRLEIISASLQGTGMYTYLKIFEISPEGDSLAEVKQDRPDYESSPDIMVDEAPVFYDPETGVYHYIFSDFIRNGYAENYENKRAVRLEEGVWKELTLANRNTVCTEPEKCTDSFTDAEGQPISEEQFAAAAQTRFAGLEPGTLKLNWNMTDSEAFSQLPREELRKNLENASIAEPADHS